MKKLIVFVLISIISVCCLTACAPPHKYSEDWSYDSEFHWHEAICIHKVQPEKIPHTMENENCSVCGYGKNSDSKPSEPQKPEYHVTSVGPNRLSSKNGNSTITVYDGDGSGKYYRNGADILKRKEYCVMPLGNLDLSYIKSMYANVKISMTFTMWEKDDGYQEIFFFNKGVTVDAIKDEKNTDKLINNGLLLAYKANIEHGPGKKLTSKKNYKVECVVAPSKITGNEIWIAFDANGNDDDTWYIENISVTVQQTFEGTYNIKYYEI